MTQSKKEKFNINQPLVLRCSSGYELPLMRNILKKWKCWICGKGLKKCTCETDLVAR